MQAIVADDPGRTRLGAASERPDAVALLSTRGLSKSFGALVALKPLSFDLGAGEIRAVCGENGAGKSTFVNLLTGVFKASAGTISIAGEPCVLHSPRDAQRHGIGLVAQELSICPELSVLDNIWLGSLEVPFLHRKEGLRRRALQALEQIGAEHIGLDRTASRLSIAERQLVEIARVLTRDARVVILDEPTATLSDREIEQIFKALKAIKAQGRSVIYITHRMAEVFEICDSVTVLRSGELVASERTADLDRGSLIEMMLGRPLVEAYPETHAESGPPILVVEGLNIPGCVEDVSFSVAQGQIVCLAGQIGSGTDALVRAVAGLIYDATGAVSVGGERLRLGSSALALGRNVLFVSGDRAEEGIFRDLKVEDNLVATRLGAFSRGGFLRLGALKAEARRLASMVGVSEQRLASVASQLSGGNQQKLAFGRCLDRGSKGVVVMLEPTRGIDVGARTEIHRLMRDFCSRGWGVLVTSTDLEELIGVGDRILTMYRGRLVGSYTHASVTMQKVLIDITHPAHRHDAS